MKKDRQKTVFPVEVARLLPASYTASAVALCAMHRYAMRLRSNLRSLARKRACGLVTLDYRTLRVLVLATTKKEQITARAIRSFLVEVARLELAASSTRNWRATNCATPRNGEKYAIFRKWSNMWSDRRFAKFSAIGSAKKVSVFKGFQRFSKNKF